MHEDVKKISKDLKGVLRRLDVVKNNALQNMSDKDLKTLAPIMGDFSRVMKATEDEDENKLNELIKKYANINK